MLSTLIFLLTLLASASAAWAQAPGGFVEPQAVNHRARYTTAEIAAFMPATRGPFTFPAPYSTEAIRITDATDCLAGQDRVRHVGYSYWRNSNAHEANPNYMWIFIGLNQGRGGTGPNLFRYDKVNHTIIKVGPLFPSGSPYRNQDGEGWSFTNTEEDVMYINNGPALLRYNVDTQAFTTVFDITGTLGSGRFIWQPHASADDRIHSAAVYLNGGLTEANAQGCVVFDENTGVTRFFAKSGDWNECQISRSGRYLMMVQNSVAGPAPDGDENRFIDLQSPAEWTVLDNNGGLGHFDAGWGYFIGLDGWNAFSGAVISFTLPGATKSTLPHFRSSGWTVNPANHVTHVNAVNTAGTAMADQVACGSTADTLSIQNEITCFKLANTPANQLIVAPVMTDPTAGGGGVASGCFDSTYCKFPHGNLDITGEYFIWTSNRGGSRLDAFLVHVPMHLLSPTPTPPTPPELGGFTEVQGTALTGVRAGRYTAAEIATFVPATRTSFTFPTPYNTTGIRLSVPGDCTAAQDCLRYVGSAALSVSNAHADQAVMRFFLSFSTSLGGAGMTLFELDKATDVVTKIGDMFPGGSPYQAQSGEEWYWSGTDPDLFYVVDATTLYQYDVVAQTTAAVFDIVAEFGAGHLIRQPHSSRDDSLHSATIRVTATSVDLGCAVYEGATLLQWYPKLSGNIFQECTLTKDGRWTISLETHTGGLTYNRFFDNTTGDETTITGPLHTLGVGDTGYGYVSGPDDTSVKPNATLLYFLNDDGTVVRGDTIHYNPNTSIHAMRYLSHVNAEDGTSRANQLLCGSEASVAYAYMNEITCVTAANVGHQLIVAPVMTNPIDTKGGWWNGGFYGVQPKGNLDITGRYFIWTTNMDGARLEAMLVKVPYIAQELSRCQCPLAPPNVPMEAHLYEQRNDDNE